MAKTLEDIEAEITELRAMVGAAFGATVSVVDIITQALQTRGIVARTELAEALINSLDKGDEEAKTLTQSGYEEQRRLVGRNLLLAVVDRLLDTPPPKQKTRRRAPLQVVK
jgi:hypothetical protein